MLTETRSRLPTNFLLGLHCRSSSLNAIYELKVTIHATQRRRFWSFLGRVESEVSCVRKVGFVQGTCRHFLGSVPYTQ
jgi:hypothetical protein